MDCILSWLTAIASLITAGGIWFLWLQIKADHERSRRERACELVLEWSKSLRQGSSLARKLVETFTEEQARKLHKSEALEIEGDKYEIIKACLEESTDTARIEQANGKVKLNGRQSSILRWHIVCYLNTLESILMARRHGVADRKMINEQFRYLVSPTEGHSILRNYRQASGGANVYPAIEEFVQELEKEGNTLLRGKKIVVK
jgi:hypothetical protein